MTTHIDYAVTEVIPEPEPAEGGESGDSRWRDRQKVEAALKHSERLSKRVRAEGFDD